MIQSFPLFVIHHIKVTLEVNKVYLVHCHVYLPFIALKIHGITSEMLVGQPPFNTVFPNFLTWIEQCVEEACCGNNDMYCPGIHICIHRIYSYIVYVYTFILQFYFLST